MKKLLSLITPKLLKKYIKQMLLEWFLGKFNIRLTVQGKDYIAMDLWEMYEIVKYERRNNKFDLRLPGIELSVDFEGVFNDD